MQLSSNLVRHRTNGQKIETWTVIAKYENKANSFWTTFQGLQRKKKKKKHKTENTYLQKYEEKS